MKKTLLLFTLLPFFAGAQQTYVPDDNFEAYLENNGMGNGIANDDSVTTANINSVDELDVHDEDISDLTGIEDFAALTILICYDNQLTSLNVSNNTFLSGLYCHQNSLTSIDVSSNTYLIGLNFAENLLTSIDVSNNIFLEWIACYQNLLTSIDLSNNTYLTGLNCGSNQLTSLDVSNNTFLNYLICSDNLLTSIDFSNNVNLETLYCGTNYLYSLDVSANIHLTTLDCFNNYLTILDVSNCTDLYYLACAINDLTSLDVSNNPELIVLYCLTNRIASLDVSNNVSLTGLSCYDNELICLNVKNGNNINMIMQAPYNLDLSCIEVDDPAWATTNWTVADYNIDAGVTFSANCSNACSSAPTEIAEFSPAVSLYPNPATDMITIDTEGLTGKIFEACIYDLSGQLVDHQRNVSRNHIEINTSTFQSGMYWCTVKTNIGQTQVKFIVQ
jgi:hypothetical protein